MTNFPASDEFRKQCMPDNILDKIDNISNSRPTGETSFMRHHITQSGVFLREDGSVEIRSGNTGVDDSLGSSLVLSSDGSAVIIAPKGLYFSGNSVYLPGPPSEVLTFDYGAYKFNSFWENTNSSLNLLQPTNPVTYRMPPETPIAVYLPGASEPSPVPLNLVFRDEELTVSK